MVPVKAHFTCLLTGPVNPPKATYHNPFSHFKTESQCIEPRVERFTVDYFGTRFGFHTRSQTFPCCFFNVFMKSISFKPKLQFCCYVVEHIYQGAALIRYNLIENYTWKVFYMWKNACNGNEKGKSRVHCVTRSFYGFDKKNIK